MVTVPGAAVTYGNKGNVVVIVFCRISTTQDNNEVYIPNMHTLRGRREIF